MIVGTDDAVDTVDNTVFPLAVDYDPWTSHSLRLMLPVVSFHHIGRGVNGQGSIGGG